MLLAYVIDIARCLSILYNEKLSPIGCLKN